jgi:hypothetical protein
LIVLFCFVVVFLCCWANAIQIRLWTSINSRLCCVCVCGCVGVWVCVFLLWL